MKVIGTIHRQFDDEGELTNLDYAEGAIIQLTKNEYIVLTLLQDAWNDNYYSYGHVGMPEEMNMDNAFKAVRVFFEAKLAVNKFKRVVERLEEIVGGVEE